MLLQDLAGRAFLRIVFAVAKPLFLRLAARPDAKVAVTLGDRDVPIRSVVLGAGVAVGFGVSGARVALPGRLAAQLSSRTGRGVEMVTRVKADAALGVLGTLVDNALLRRQDLVVLCPALPDLLHGGSPRWHALLFATVQQLRRWMRPDARLVLLGLPLPQYDGLLERIALGACEETNRVLGDVARTTAGTAYVAAPPFDTLRPSGRSFDAAFYERCAARIADAVSVDLGLRSVSR